MDSLLVAHIAITFFMTGLVWFVQVVHYPLFRLIGDDAFKRYVVDHARLITLVGFPGMLLELVTGIMLGLTDFAVDFAPLYWVGMLLIVFIWISTFALQVPLNTRLASGFNQAIYRSLIQSNWIRTLSWSLRCFLLVTVLLSLNLD